MKSWVFVSLVALFFVYASSSPSDFFSTKDAEALKRLITNSQTPTGSFGDIAATHFAVKTLLASGEQVPNKDKVCSFAKSVSKDDIAAIHYSVAVTESLGCGERISEDLTSSLEEALKKGSIPSIYHALKAYAALKPNDHVILDETSADSVAQHLLKLLEGDGLYKAEETDEEGSAYNAGLALHCLALLQTHFPNEADEDYVSSLVDGIEDLFSNAEINNGLSFPDTNPMLNLRTTSLIWTGLNALAKTNGVQVDEQKISGFAEYFANHKHVGDLADACFLYTALKTISKNNFNKQPLVVTLPSASILATSKRSEANVRVRVTDIFGQATVPVAVFLNRAFPVADETNVILRNQEALSEEGDATTYSFNFLSSRPDQGFYALEFSVSPVGKSSGFIAAADAIRNIKVVALAELAEVSFKVSESKDENDDTYASVTSQPQYPNKEKDVLNVDIFQHLFISFRVKAGNKPVLAHQTFVRLKNLETQREIIFVAKAVGKKYKLSLGIKDNIAAFGAVSGKYAITLLVGDSFIQNPINWEAIVVNLNFGTLSKNATVEYTETASLPEIHHQFRQPEKRPPPVVSNAFTVLVLSPILVLLIGLVKVGANISNFPFGGLAFIWALGFQACIGAILSLFVVYWLDLTMIQTLIYLGVLGIFTLFFGQRALRHVASLNPRKADKKKTN